MGSKVDENGELGTKCGRWRADWRKRSLDLKGLRGSVQNNGQVGIERFKVGGIRKQVWEAKNENMGEAICGKNPEIQSDVSVGLWSRCYSSSILEALG